MNKEDPVTMHGIRGYMNDYRIIEDSNEMVSFKTFLPDPDNPGQELCIFKERASKFSPEKSVVEHKETLRLLKEALDSRPTKKWVVVGHHAPSRMSTHPRYKDEQLMNGAYSSDLSNFIIDHPQIKLWTHGHTHEDFDYMVGSTRIVCNPRGYINYEDRADNFNLKTVEI